MDAETAFPTTDADATPSFGLLSYFSSVADAVTEAVYLAEILTATADADATSSSFFYFFSAVTALPDAANSK